MADLDTQPLQRLHKLSTFIEVTTKDHMYSGMGPGWRVLVSKPAICPTGMSNRRYMLPHAGANAPPTLVCCCYRLFQLGTKTSFSFNTSVTIHLTRKVLRSVVNVYAVYLVPTTGLPRSYKASLLESLFR